VKYKIIYDSPGRLRVRCGQDAFLREQEESLTEILSQIHGVSTVKVSSANGGILLTYREISKEILLERIRGINANELKKRPVSKMKQIDDDFKHDFITILIKRMAMKLFVPSFLKTPMTVIRALPYIKSGLMSLSNGKLNVEVLDAASITAAIAGGSVSTASSVMTLLNVSSLLEGYTRKKTQNALSDSLAINIDTVWKVTDDCPKKVPLKSVLPGDVLRVQHGNMIPIDGIVKSGEAEVNEAAMTGEAMPQHKSAGASVYAGTVIEGGNLDITVSAMPDNNRINKVIELIETSDSLKSSVQTSAEKFADSLVPFSFGLSIATYFLTGNLTKAMSVLMVDYSCAIKLSTPICVISAMREAANHEIMVKGGRFLENYALADTIVFDKTGTLTVSCPKLAKVIAFGDYSEDEILRTAACLEEHFPHSVAKAIVRAAEEKNLCHEEKHADVEYVVAHGIATQIGGQRALIGSAHFIFDDEKIPITDEQKRCIEAEGLQYSMVYLAIGNVLEGVLCIEDPIRENAAEVIGKLKDCGLSDVMMITGDGEHTAKSVCEKIGIEKFHAKVLPEDKLNIIEKLKADDHKVVMVGDGINDSPALAAADVSVAMKDASDIAREVADITLLTSDLDKLVVLRILSERLFKRIYNNYRFIALFNSSLLLLGMVGVLSPSSSALLHNLSTMGICAKSMKLFLDEEEQ
jgi:heavy metal translocating P-type ATPase